LYVKFDLPLVVDYEKYFHLVCWGIPLILAIIAGTTGVIGNTGPWCWILTEYTGYRFGLFYGWMFFAWVVNAVFLGLTARCIYEGYRNYIGVKVKAEASDHRSEASALTLISNISYTRYVVLIL
jgi:hypothetical protein